MRAIRRISLLSTFPTRDNVLCLHGDPKTQKSARPQAARGCAARVWIFGTSTTTHHTGVPESSAREHDEASLRWLHWRKLTLGEHEVCCRGGEIIPAIHVPAETSCRILVRTKGFVTQTQMIRCFCLDTQIHRTRQAKTFQSCV